MSMRFTLDVLWGRRERPTRGPKPGLSVDQIVVAAIEIADAGGLEALSMRAVAARLGVGTMSLYRHVPGKAELVDLMMDRVLGEDASADEAAEGWRAKLELWARQSWALYQRHPWMLQIPVTRPALGPNVIGDFDAMLHAVSGIGLTPSEMVAVVSVIGGYVRGAVETTQVERRTGVSDEQWWSERLSFWEEYFDPERFPTISWVYDEGGFDEPEDTFDFGLQRVLDGIEAFLRAK